jgi:hypothetical protein
MDEKYIAFLDVLELDENTAFRGGCLVTDQETKPVEFRCTAAIRPTELQRVLYGKKLLEYVCNDLVGLPIIKALQSKPSLVLVRLPELLKLRPEIAVPILWIETSPEGDIQRISPFAGYREEAEGAKSVLKNFSKEEIIEPFTRVQNAVEEAHRQKVGDVKQEKPGGKGK